MHILLALLLKCYGNLWISNNRSVIFAAKYIPDPCIEKKHKTKGIVLPKLGSGSNFPNLGRFRPSVLNMLAPSSHIIPCCGVLRPHFPVPMCCPRGPPLHRGVAASRTVRAQLSASVFFGGGAPSWSHPNQSMR